MASQRLVLGYELSLRIVPEKFEADIEAPECGFRLGGTVRDSPFPPFFVSTDSKGLSVFCKSFKMNTCENLLEVFILKGLHDRKNR